MKKRICFKLLLFYILIVSSVSAQEIEWQRTIGGFESDRLRSIIITPDGGYLLGGNSSSNIGGEKTEIRVGGSDYWVIKLDSTGLIQWQNTIGGFGDDSLTSILNTPDGGFICSGHSVSDGSGDKSENSIGLSDYWVLKLDNIGNIEWQHTIGGTNVDKLYSIALTLDGGYICGGVSLSNISGDKSENCKGSYDYWLVKMDSTGDILWDKTIGGTGLDVLVSLATTSDGGYICGGYSTSNVGGDKSEICFGDEDYWIVKLDSIGGIQWQNTIGGSNSDKLISFIALPSGGFICGGSSLSDISFDKNEDTNGSSDGWIVKLDSLGGIEWQETIGGIFDDYFGAMALAPNGGYFCGLSSNSIPSGDKTENSYGSFDYWVLKLDSVGNVIWQNTLLGNLLDENTVISGLPDGSFLCGGNSNSNIFGDKTENCRGQFDLWVVKLTENFNHVTGKAYIDLNGNQIKDSLEAALNFLKVSGINTSYFTYTGADGKYSLPIFDSGSYVISPAILNYYSPFPLSYNVNLAQFQQIDSLKDFAFQPISTTDDLRISITPQTPFRPGFNGSYMINYENVGTTVLTPNIVFHLFPFVNYISSSITPATIYNDSIVWNLPALSPFQKGQISVVVNLSTTIPLGTILNSYVQISPLSNDADPSNNNATWEVTVTGSYDPNDILVDKDTLLSTLFPNTPFLEYLIRFQNTGTDTAFTVKIINPIDTLDFYLNTFDMISSSHPVIVNYVAYGKAIEFRHENILLADSNTNEPASHGFVRYKILPKEKLWTTNYVRNMALIYFDFNEAVVTNTIYTRVVTPTGIEDSSPQINLGVFPNPVTQELIVETMNVGNETLKLELYNLYGKKLKDLYHGKCFKQFKFDVGDLNSGVYFIRYNVNGVTNSVKFVKM
jgi:hypothetical protein